MRVCFAAGAQAGAGTAGLATAQGGQPINVNAGDLIEVLEPATVDATLSDMFGFLSLVQY